MSNINDNKLFNLTPEQIKKQSGSTPDKCDYNTPIQSGETLDPCLRGAEKLLADSEKKEMLYRIYRGVREND